MAASYAQPGILKSANEIGSLSLRTAAISINACPALLNCRAAITLAFREAEQCKHGRPTQLALDAVDWIMARTDWTKIGIERRLECWNSPAPPIEVRREFEGTFDWCCQWLSEDPDTVREHGLLDPFAKARQGGLKQIYEKWKSELRKI